MRREAQRTTNGRELERLLKTHAGPLACLQVVELVACQQRARADTPGEFRECLEQQLLRGDVESPRGVTATISRGSPACARATVTFC